MVLEIVERYEIREAIENDDLVLEEAHDLQDSIGYLTSQAKNLDQLYEALTLQTLLFEVVPQEWHHDLGIDFAKYIEDFPLFSEEEPESTLGIWSYDDERAITSDGWARWRIEPRSDMLFA